MKPNISLFNSMIRARAESSNPIQAMTSFIDLRRSGLLGDNYTYPFVLKACGLVMALSEGKQLHGQVVKCGFGFHLLVVNGLIGMYCKCGELGSAKSLFDGLQSKDMVSWNLMLGGYVLRGELGDAQKMFDAMPDRDVVSWSILIDGYCKKNGNVRQARVLFDKMPVRDLVAWNSMINGYVKVGELAAARELFELMPRKNVISWSIMIEGYAHHGNPQEALRLFRKMLLEDEVRPDKMSVVGALSACAQLGMLLQGQWIHTYIKKKKISMDVVLQTALMDMYTKCGSLEEARSVFDSMTERNNVSYSVMILGLGINGYGKEALMYLSEMVSGEIQGDDMTFLAALTACSHSGLVSEGLRIFDEMRRFHMIDPKLEHYGCLVDLLGRAGRLDQARGVIESMPMKPNSALWGSLLLASRTHHDPSLAEVAVQKLRELGADDCGTFVLLSNIYADAGMWEESRKIRKHLKDMRMGKEMGKSVIEVYGNMVEFKSGDDSSLTIKELRQVLWTFSKIALSADLLGTS